MNFKEKVRAMSGAEIIMAMVEGLRHPAIVVRMNTYGRQINGVCFGCAATATVERIAGISFTPDDITYCRPQALGIEVGDGDYHFLAGFEKAIDALRCGNIEEYNEEAKDEGFARIFLPKDMKLPELDNDYTEADLLYYVALAAAQSVSQPTLKEQPCES